MFPEQYPTILKTLLKFSLKSWAEESKTSFKKKVFLIKYFKTFQKHAMRMGI